MDLDHPGVFLSSMLIGVIGMGVFIYGKKSGDFKSLAIGLLMCVFPYFVHSLLVMWLATAACFGGMFVLSKTT